MGQSVFPAPATGPTLAEITSAITTNAAPASVTNSSIATQVANNAPSANNWTVISSITPNATVGTYTFSSLSGYKSYRIIASTIPSVATTQGIRFNGDSSGIYNYAFKGVFANTLEGTAGLNDSKWTVGNLNDNVISTLDVTIDNATVGSYKTGKGWSIGRVGGTTNIDDAYGIWRSTAAITSITFFMVTAGTFNSGNITLLGAN